MFRDTGWLTGALPAVQLPRSTVALCWLTYALFASVAAAALVCALRLARYLDGKLLDGVGSEVVLTPAIVACLLAMCADAYLGQLHSSATNLGDASLFIRADYISANYIFR